MFDHRAVINVIFFITTGEQRDIRSTKLKKMEAQWTSVLGLWEGEGEEQTPLKFPNITHMRGNERNVIWAKGRSATLDTSVHPDRYFADLVGTQGTAWADNAASTPVWLPACGRIRRAGGAIFPDFVTN